MAAWGRVAMERGTVYTPPVAGAATAVGALDGRGKVHGGCEGCE